MLWIAIGVPVLLFGLCMIGGLVGSLAPDSGSYESSNGPIVWEDVSVIDFIDNTSGYRGDELEFEMMYSDYELRPLRQRFGHRVTFWISDIEADASGEVIIDIPAGLNVPNASNGDTVIVRFECREGRLNLGNVAISIERP